MPRGAATDAQSKNNAIYSRGDYWLGTRSVSENFYVFRYDIEGRRTRYWTTHTSDVTEAMKKLDEHWLASTDQSPAYCDKCGQKIADGSAYSVIQAIADYKLEHGSKMVSYEAIRSRLNHVVRFVLERNTEDLPCSAATSDQFAKAFRAWLMPQPVIWTNLAGEITTQHVRTRSSVEESVHQLRAALNFAVKRGRSDAKPVFATSGRSVVSKPIKTRASLDQLGEMVAYAAEPNKRREGLYRFIVASICTVGRPDAIFDMNVSPERFQYDADEKFFDLNPHGREQTKKYRPTLPILSPLQALIDTASDDGWVVHYYGRQVDNVRSAWRAMVADLGYPGGREWGAYILRRSMSKLLRESGALAWDVQGYMGHRTAGTTEIYTHGSLFPTATEKLESIVANIDTKSGYCISTFARQLRVTDEKDPV